MASDTSGSSVTSIPLEEEPYFHGEVGREEVQQLVQREGDFIVRLAETQGKKRTVITVMKGTAKHFIVNKSREGYFYLEKKVFESVNDLVRYHMATKEALTAKSGAQLLSPVLRESWEVSQSQIKLGDKIGEGTFGYTYKGTFHHPKDGKKEVAIKLCNDSPAQQDRIAFMKEARRMRGYDHPNIVRLLGVSAQQKPLTLIMEYVPGGSLLDHLKAATPIPTKINFCLDAARGMEYLESQGCIHRDLAARNCLLKGKQVKISDYGLSRNQDFNKNKGDKKLPVRWMAPEVLTKSKHTHKSDTWSFGILLWEIFSNGTTPYKGMSNEEVWKKVAKEKYRMKPPDKTPSPIQELMNKSSDHNPDRRPNFSHLKKELERLATRSHR